MKKAVLVLGGLVVPLATALAQDDIFAAAALAATPIGALTPLMSPSMVGRRLNSAQFALRYGQRRDGSTNTFGIAASTLFAVSLKSSVSLTAGVRATNAPLNNNPRLMLGVGGDMRIYEGGEIAGAGSGLGLEDHAYALGVGVPVTVSLATGGRQGLHVVPFFSPLFGVGQVKGDTSQSGTRVVLGGGIGVWNPLTSVSASLGVNRVMRTGEKPVFGINVILGGR
jgi:hypothetical protein